MFGKLVTRRFAKYFFDDAVKVRIVGRRCDLDKIIQAVGYDLADIRIAGGKYGPFCSVTQHAAIIRPQYDHFFVKHRLFCFIKEVNRHQTATSCPPSHCRRQFLLPTTYH
jgi:hypothetical protein